MNEHRRATVWMALAASSAAHALLVALWLHGSTQKTPAPATASPSRVGFTIRLLAAAAAATLPTAAPLPPVVSPRRPPRARPPAPTPVAAPQPVAPVPAAEAPSPAVAVGGQFAGLFEPVLARPLGRGGWGRGGAVAPEPMPRPSELPHEQARQALLTSLLGRLHDLTARLAANGQDLRCRVAVDSSLRLAEVDCADPADRGAPWSALQGLLVAGRVPPGSASLCVGLSGPQVAVAACGDEVALPNP